MQKKNIPTVFVIFGATGDLVQRKIFSSLLTLYAKGKLPKMLQIVGFARRPMTDQEFQVFVKKALGKQKDISSETVEKFLGHFLYHQGNFSNQKDYVRLAERLGRIDGTWNVCANKLFYLAAPPQYYETIFEHLSSSGLTIPCSPEEGWTRVIVEKPFGKDLETAKKLDVMLGKLFREEQIYRIDHYLGKEMLQSILSFRFANTIFEESWNNKHVEKIEVRILETSSLSARGDFYEGVGALRDVGQNHALQMLALVAMDRPRSFSSEQVRASRARLLSEMHDLTLGEIKKNTYRAQYTGYRTHKGVHPESVTETYFRVISKIDSPRWAGVPVILEAGKEMPEQKREIVVTFKPSAPLFSGSDGVTSFQNKVRFVLEPESKIIVEFWTKKPGLEFVMQQKTFEFSHRESLDLAQEYERLLLDVISGNQLLFVSTDEVAHMWSFVDPVARAWEKDLVPLAHYKKRDAMLFESVPDLGRSVTDEYSNMPREIGLIGLGKMGNGIATRLLEQGWRVVAYNRTPDDTQALERIGGMGAYSLGEFFEKLSTPRVVLVSLPHVVLDEVFFDKDGLINYLSPDDILIDAGNSHYADTVKRAKKFQDKKIRFVDVGVSGGPGGARYGASLMIGGQLRDYEYLRPLFQDMSVYHGEEFFGGVGAGHFVKMVHNGIEYGMMQAIAEGFDVMKNAEYKLDLSQVASVYNHGSVVESKLVGWLHEAFEVFGQDLSGISGSVAHSGEGKWTVETASKLGIKVRVIEDALKFRIQSEHNPTYAGKILSALRNRFGGHSASSMKK